MDNRYLRDFDLPDDEDEASWGVIRRFWWNPSVREGAADVELFGGNQLLATFSTRDELLAFVSGMATAYMALPPEVVRSLEAVLGVEPGWEDRPAWWNERDLP